MNVNMEVTAKLTPQEVNEIIKDYLEKQGYAVASIKPLISTRVVGQMMNEYEVNAFDGIEAKIKVAPIKPDDKDKNIVWDNR